MVYYQVHRSAEYQDHRASQLKGYKKRKASYKNGCKS